MSHGITSAPPLPYWERKWCLGVVFGGFSLLYLLQRSPYVGFNDGLSFLYAASKGFDLDTNATSHFLYNNLQHVLVWALPFLPDVLVLTLFSVACALGTLGMVYRLGRLLAPSQGAALLPVVALGVSFTFWQQSEVIEVYAFNNLVFTAFLYCAVRDLRAHSRSNYLATSLFLGLGLITHIQHILSLPFFLAYLWGRNDLRWTQRCWGMLPWMSMMSILFFLPAYTGAHAWTAVFFESKFQDALMGVDARSLATGVLMGVGMLLYNFQLALVPMAAGWRHLWRTDRNLVWWMVALGLPYLAFATKYSVRDNHVFYLVVYLLLALPLVHGTGNEAERRKRIRWMLPAGFVLPILVYALATLLAPMLPPLQRYDMEKAYKGGVTHLLWPGKAWARDPLEIARRRAQRCEGRPGDKTEEWNYATAVQYLRLRCAQGHLQQDNGWTMYPPVSAMPPECFFDCP